MTIYGYARVSSTDQNLDRQIKQLKQFVADDRFIITDKASGKDFDRKGYNLLVGSNANAPLLRENDLLVITSLDRLGRNYVEIREQWETITHKIKANIKVLDMPLLDTSNHTDNLDTRFVADLVLQVLSYVAEKERKHIKDRQRQGIEVAKAQGKHLGRPRAKYPNNWVEVYTQWKAKEITAVQAQQLLQVPPTTFYKLVNRYMPK